MPNLLKILYIKNRFVLKYRESKQYLSVYDNLRLKKKCLVFLAADYGNLGDVAITYAQELFIKDLFPEYEVIDVPISKTLFHLKSLRNICNDDDIITIVGGGNMSDLYFDIELLRQMVVNAFPNNRIISFPQTMFFNNTLSGKYLKHLAEKTYSRHNFLTVTARENETYESMKSMFSDCRLLPDIVMTLDKREPETERKGITLCLRNDAESSISQDFKDNLRSQLIEKYELSYYDTHIGRGGLSLQNRKIELNKIWAQFRSSEWIITDRLHGMIFAFITGTPAIVLANNNHKIEGCYRWIKNCGYIHFLKNESIERIIQLLNSSIFNNFESVHKDIVNQFSLLLNNE